MCLYKVGPSRVSQTPREAKQEVDTNTLTGILTKDHSGGSERGRGL